jgi:hypothetical protein
MPLGGPQLYPISFSDTVPLSDNKILQVP